MVAYRGGGGGTETHRQRYGEGLTKNPCRPESD